MRSVTSVSVGSICCDRCGAAFRPAALAAVVLCPYCQYQQPLDQRRLRQLQGYQAQVAYELSDADEQARQLASYQKWFGDTGEKSGKYSSTAQFFLAYAGCSLVLALVCLVPVQLELMTWNLYFSTVLIGGFTLGFFGYLVLFVRGMSHARVARSAPRALTVLCPNCGAPGELTPGDALDTCKHCRAALVPSAAAMRLGEAAAHVARRRVAMARYRKERSVYTQMFSQSMGLHVYLSVGSFGLMLGASTLMLAVEAIQTRDASALRGLIVLGGMNLALWGVVFGVFWWGRMRKAKIAASMRQLAARLGGQSLQGTALLVAWLNAYWCGPFEIQQLSPGRYHHQLQLVSAGYSTLVDYNPNAGKYVVERLQLLLAAEIPGVQISLAKDSYGQMPHMPWPQLSAQAEHALRTLQQLRFEVRLSEAGLLAVADRGLLRQCAKQPESLAQLEAVVPWLVYLASQMGGRPVRAEA